jgi:hypothetical protein
LSVSERLVPRRDRERRRPDPRSEEADRRRAEHDQREWCIQEENANKGERGHGTQEPVAQGAAADAQNRVDDDGEDRRSDAPEKTFDERDLVIKHVEDAERHHHRRTGKHEQDSGDQSADCPMQQPAEIDGELLRLRARQQHAVVERVQKARLVDPALLVDDDPVHQRDLPGGSTKAHQADLQPRPESFGERRPARGE